MRLIRHRSSLAIAGLLAAGLTAVTVIPDAALAQGKLDARYTASLAGVPLGRGAWVVEIAEDQYTAAASGATAGVLRIFSSGQGTGAVRGNVAGGNLVPANYNATISGDRKSDEVRMTLVSGSVKEAVILPPPEPNPDAIPITDAHRRGIVDPMTGTLVRVPGNGDLLAPESCQRRFSVFDGRMRYDLSFEFKRVEQVKAEKGYEGPVLVCAAYFNPIAGYVPSRAAIKYLIKQRDMEVWLAPITGTRVLVPYRFSVPTPLGLGVLEATQFVSTPRPAPPRAAAQPKAL